MNPPFIPKIPLKDSKAIEKRYKPTRTKRKEKKNQSMKNNTFLYKQKYTRNSISGQEETRGWIYTVSQNNYKNIL